MRPAGPSALVPALVLLAGLVAAGLGPGRPGGSPPDSALPHDRTRDGADEYVSSRACRPCHPGEYASWYRTYHRTMTQVATAETILAPWDDVTLSHEGRGYRLFRDGDRFVVDMPLFGTTGRAPDERLVRPVVMTTGSHHMQYYWVNVPWDGAPPERRGRAVFARTCARCHGPDGVGLDDEPAPALLEAQLEPGAVRGALGDATHAAVAAPLDPADRDALLRFVDQIQFPGRWAPLPFAYLLRDRRWVHDDDTYLQPPSSPRRTEPFQNHWYDNCQWCHSTGPATRWDADGQRGEAIVAELGIACEACHGPGRRHVERYRDPLSRYEAHLGPDRPARDIVNPARLDPARATAVCGQCHAETVAREGYGPEDFRPGDRLEETVHVLRLLPEPRPPWLEEELAASPTLFRDAFWPDGTIRITGRDVNGLVETACFTRGSLSCLSCHSMHDAEPDDMLSEAGRGDGACIGCHAEIGRDVAAHTHHPTASSGSRCMNCHMPHTTWGLLGAVRAHRIDSPSAATTAATGRPNACNLCHLDKTLAEVATSLADWYGQPPVDTLDPDHRETAASLVWLLRGDAVQRAVAAWHLGWPPALEASGNDWQAAALAEALEDPYAAVRYAAGHSLRRLPGFADFAYDYVGPAVDRAKARRVAAFLWRRGYRGPADRPALLIREGALDERGAAALAARRDDTPIQVAE